MIRYLHTLGLAALALSTRAQSLRPGLDTLAIVGARIEVEPGKVIEKGNLVVKNGLIVEVGENVQVPAGADIVDGKGLFVFAGFVDCGVTTGLKKAPERPRQAEQFDPSTDFATTMRWESPTVRPDLLAADLFDPDDSSWKAERSAGFTSTLIYPGTGVLKGQAAFVDTDGRARQRSIVASPLGLVMDFIGGGDPYPGTSLGSFATARQAFLDADWIRTALVSYEKAGAPRPPNDPGLAALESLKGLPAIFEADPIWKIDSVLSFAKEIGMRPIVLGGKEAYKQKGCLSGVDAVLKIDFTPEPVPAKDDKAEKAEKTEPELAPEPEAKKAERQRVWLEGVNNARTLLEGGTRFALTSQGCKDQATFFTNLRRAMKEGLPREAALAALTVNPAKIFGVENVVGTVSPGKIANLTILTKDFVDPESKVKFLIVDGIKIDPSKEPFKPDNTPQDFGKEGGQ